MESLLYVNINYKDHFLDKIVNENNDVFLAARQRAKSSFFLP